MHVNDNSKRNVENNDNLLEKFHRLNKSEIASCLVS